MHHMAQETRMRESFRGFPWRDDDAIHPARWRRVPAERMRLHLDAHPAEPADLACLARLIGTAPPTALRTFRAVYGQRRTALRGTPMG